MDKLPEPDKSTVTLDHLDNLTLSNAALGAHGNELHSLDYLSQCLHLLHKFVNQAEKEVSGRLDNNYEYLMGGNDEALQRIPQGLIACAFHWYAVSVCNHVRLVGWLASAGDSAKAREYLKRVLPEVYIWRNKVAAHFARIDPKEEDGVADLVKSVMFPLSFERDAFYVGSLTLTTGSGGKSSTSRKDMRWSLTHTHRDLTRRYWPTSTSEQG